MRFSSPRHYVVQGSKTLASCILSYLLLVIKEYDRARVFTDSVILNVREENKEISFLKILFSA